MKKMRLDLEQIQVESFDTSPESKGSGTVQGFINTDDNLCITTLAPTCMESCPCTTVIPDCCGATCEGDETCQDHHCGIQTGGGEFGNPRVCTPILKELG